jgi:hypothetical protein
MNSRLKELMLEAGYAAPELAGRANKLAELLVEECAKVADRAWNDPGTYPGNLVRKQFGVDE